MRRPWYVALCIVLIASLVFPLAPRPAHAAACPRYGIVDAEVLAEARARKLGENQVGLLGVEEVIPYSSQFLRQSIIVYKVKKAAPWAALDVGDVIFAAGCTLFTVPEGLSLWIRGMKPGDESFIQFLPKRAAETTARYADSWYAFVPIVALPTEKNVHAARTPERFDNVYGAKPSTPTPGISKNEVLTLLAVLGLGLIVGTIILKDSDVVSTPPKPGVFSDKEPSQRAPHRSGKPGNASEEWGKKQKEEPQKAEEKQPNPMNPPQLFPEVYGKDPK